MQRVKRKHAKDEFIEDVDSDPESGSELSTEPQLLPSSNEDRYEESVPLTSKHRKGHEDEIQIVAIVNENVRESTLTDGRSSDIAQGNKVPDNIYSDVPISLVLANNNDQYSEDIPTPVQSKIGPSQVALLSDKQETVVKETDEEPRTISLENNLRAVNCEKIENNNEDENEDNDTIPERNGELPDSATLQNIQEATEEQTYDEAYELTEFKTSENDVETKDEEVIYQESNLAEVAEDKMTTPVPDIDEYGNLLDENGHPIIKHAFPESWTLLPDEGDGIMRFDTDDGPVRFIMELGYNYPNPPNEYKLEMDVYMKKIPTTHLLSSGCKFFVDNGIWKLELDMDVFNTLLRMDIADDFEDVTGEVMWNNSKDITIENIKRAMTIFKDCVLDESPVRWFLARDAVYHPKDGTFRLSVGCDVENMTKNISIHKGMTFVESKTTVDIPRPHNTEFKNDNTFLIYEDSMLEEQGIRHLDSGGCTIAKIANRHLDSGGVKVEETATTHQRYQDSILEDQGTRHILCEEGEMVDIVRGHNFNEDVSLEDIVRSFVISDDSDRVDIKRHHIADGQTIERPPANWESSQFDGELVDITEMQSVKDYDIKLVISPAKFNLNQIKIDEDFLAEEDD